MSLCLRSALNHQILNFLAGSVALCCSGLTPTSSWGKETERWREDSENETVWQVKQKLWAHSKAKQEFIYYFLSTRQVYSHFPESRASASIRVTQEDKCQNHKYCPLSPFPKLLLLKIMSDVAERLSGQSWGHPPSAVLAVSPVVSAMGKGEQKRQKEQPWLALLCNS